MEFTAIELLQQLNALDESPTIEAKRSSEMGKSVLETVCAYANEPGLGGGHLLLGVSSRNNLFENEYFVEGIDDPDQLQSDLASQCATMFNIPIRPILSVEKLKGQTVIVVTIPEAAPTDKPIYLKKSKLPSDAFRRIGSTDQHCTEDDLIVLYQGHQLETYDSTIVFNSDMNDIDPEAISLYRAMREKTNPEAEELSWNDEDLLRALSCLIKTSDRKLQPTVAGLLLFGKPMALRKYFPMMRIDYIRVTGKTWVENPDLRFDTLEIRRPLLSAVRSIQASILDDLPMAFSLPEDSMQSKGTPLLPRRVIREAVVNAVMHRSYRIHSPIQIIRYSNRLEIRNPGHSLKSTDRLGEPGSEHRNPKIAAILHELDLAETKGSGIRVMRELMDSNNLMPPTFESSRQDNSFSAIFLFHHFLGKEDISWLNSLSDEIFTDEESRALVFVREVGAIDNASYREINRTDTLGASTHLRRLRDLELLGKKGAGNKTYYVPGPSFYPLAPGDYSEQPGDYSNNGQTAPDKEQPSRDYLISLLPSTLVEKLHAQKKKPRKEVIREIILQICSQQAFSAAELTKMLNRKDRKPLVRDYLTPMIEDGALEYTIPAMKDHPEQKYRIPA